MVVNLHFLCFPQLCICTQLIKQLVWRGAKQEHGKSFLEAELGTSLWLGGLVWCWVRYETSFCLQKRFSHRGVISFVRGCWWLAPCEARRGLHSASMTACLAMTAKRGEVFPAAMNSVIFSGQDNKKSPKTKKTPNPVNQPETICWQFCKTPLGPVGHRAAPSWNPYAWQERGWQLVSCSSSLLLARVDLSNTLWLLHS